LVAATFHIFIVTLHRHCEERSDVARRLKPRLTSSFKKCWRV